MRSQGLLEEIKSRIDIVDFISDYVSLKKAGQNFRGLCPFHAEKTPSFMVSPSKQIFHCFGCSAGGDVVSFLIKQENLSFAEALRYLAGKTGVEIKEFQQDNAAASRREALLKVNEDAAHFFSNTLARSHAALQYLSKRGIRADSLDRFRLGFSGTGRDDLCTHLKKRGHPGSLLVKAGLASPDGAGVRDYFRKRIMFPICNQKGDVIAFGGRVMDSSPPKYLNSPETEVFRKGDTLFAMHLAKDEIRKSGYAFIVEGYLDVIICHQEGFINTVAPLGTALTPRHLQRLGTLTRKAVLVFDGDSAGLSAARRSLPILCESDFSAKILLLPEGEDPDSFLQTHGAAEFRALLSEAMSAVEFVMVKTNGDRVSAVREVLGIIAAVKDILKAEEMLRELTHRSGMNESVLRGELQHLKRKTASPQLRQAQAASFPVYQEERLLLSALLSSPEKAGEALVDIPAEQMKDVLAGSLLRKMLALGREFTTAALIEVSNDEEKALITELSLRPGFDMETIDENIEDCLRKFRLRELEEQRKRAEASGDISLLDSLLKEKGRLMREVGQ